MRDLQDRSISFFVICIIYYCRSLIRVMKQRYQILSVEVSQSLSWKYSLLCFSAFLGSGWNEIERRSTLSSNCFTQNWQSVCLDIPVIIETQFFGGGEHLADLILDHVGMLSSEGDILTPVINFVKHWELIFILICILWLQSDHTSFGI